MVVILLTIESKLAAKLNEVNVSPGELLQGQDRFRSLAPALKGRKRVLRENFRSQIGSSRTHLQRIHRCHVDVARFVLRPKNSRKESLRESA